MIVKYGNKDKIPEIGDYIKAQNDPSGKIFEIDKVSRGGRTLHLKGFPSGDFVSLFRVDFICSGKMKENIMSF